jgi:hypothetical protein
MADAPANAPTDIGKLAEEETGELVDGVLDQGAGEHHTPVDFDSLIDKSAAELMKKDPNAGAAGEGQSEEDKQAAADALQKQREETEAAEAQAEKERLAAEAREGETPEEKTAREATEKVEADRIAAEEAQKNKQTDAQKARDADLDKLDSDVGEHVKPTTRKIIDSFKTNARKARDEAETARAETTALRAQLEEAKKGGVPKEIEGELTALRDRVREVDALQDPAIIEKYQILDTLAKAGMKQPEIDVLKKRGLTVGTIKQYIDFIDAGRGPDTIGPDGKKVAAIQHTPDPDTAESLREALRDNARLAKARDAEIDTWRAGHATRSQQQSEQIKQRAEATNRRAQDEVGKYVAEYDFLQKPSEPLANDPPAVKKVKQDAITAHNAAINLYAEAVKRDTGTVGDAYVHARVGVLLRDVVVPNLKKQRDALSKKLAEAEGELAKIKKAGSMSRTVSPAPRAPKEGEGNEPEVNQDDPFGGIIDSLASSAAAKKQ